MKNTNSPIVEYVCEKTKKVSKFVFLFFFLTITLDYSYAETNSLFLQEINKSLSDVNLSLWSDYDGTLSKRTFRIFQNDYTSSFENKFRLGINFKPYDSFMIDLSGKYQQLRHTQNYRDIDDPVWMSQIDKTYSNTRKNETFKTDRIVISLNLLDSQLSIVGGRRPSSDVITPNSINNKSRYNEYANLSILTQYSLDGITTSYRPNGLSNLGSYISLSYGKGYNNTTSYFAVDNYPDSALYRSRISDITIVPINKPEQQLWFQWLKGYDIYNPYINESASLVFTDPLNNTTTITIPEKEGTLDWFSAGFNTKYKFNNGDLNLYSCLSVNHAKLEDNSVLLYPPYDYSEIRKQNKYGHALFLAARYDFNTSTKVGIEYNYGSKYWITATSDQNGKLGTKGYVFEPFVIQEITPAFINPMFPKTFIRIGYQYYTYNYIGSNTWISETQPYDINLTFFGNAPSYVLHPRHSNVSYASIIFQF